MICRHQIFRQLILDSERENKAKIIELMQCFKIKQFVVFAFYPQANGMVEHGHKPIMDAFAKITNRSLNNWIESLLAFA